MMNKKKNYIIESIKYIQCIANKLVVKTALIHKVEINSSEINELKIKDSNSPNSKIIRSNFNQAIIRDSDLTNVNIESCKLDGMRINGHLVSELIKEREEIIKTKGDKLL